MPYTGVKSLKLNIQDKEGLRAEKKYLTSKLTLLKNNILDQKNHEDELYRQAKELALMRRELDEGVIKNIQSIIQDLEQC